VLQTLHLLLRTIDLGVRSNMTSMVNPNNAISGTRGTLRMDMAVCTATRTVGERAEA
jgi:hypothetical protein